MPQVGRTPLHNAAWAQEGNVDSDKALIFALVAAKSNVDAKDKVVGEMEYRDEDTKGELETSRDRNTDRETRRTTKSWPELSCLVYPLWRGWAQIDEKIKV